MPLRHLCCLRHIIDHAILTHRLSSLFGISGTVLSWIKLYLISRPFTVNVAGHTSNPQTLTCDVPQGFVLCPLLFILYTAPLSKLISSSSVDHHLYADDKQLLIGLSFFPHSLQDALNHIRNTITQISAWMTTNQWRILGGKSGHGPIEVGNGVWPPSGAERVMVAL